MYGFFQPSLASLLLSNDPPASSGPPHLCQETAVIYGLYQGASQAEGPQEPGVTVMHLWELGSNWPSPVQHRDLARQKSPLQHPESFSCS